MCVHMSHLVKWYVGLPGRSEVGVAKGKGAPTVSTNCYKIRSKFCNNVSYSDILCIVTCRPGQTWALPWLFRIMHIHITRTGREDTWSPAYNICVHRRTYSVQCSDKIRVPQLDIKCGVAKSCPGTHTALQVGLGKII